LLTLVKPNVVAHSFLVMRSTLMTVASVCILNSSSNASDAPVRFFASRQLSNRKPKQYIAKCVSQVDYDDDNHQSLFDRFKPVATQSRKNNDRRQTPWRDSHQANVSPGRRMSTVARRRACRRRASAGPVCPIAQTEGETTAINALLASMRNEELSKKKLSSCRAQGPCFRS
jgi:hypothetical protein